MTRLDAKLRAGLPEDPGSRRTPTFSWAEAVALVERYNSEPFHLEHAHTVAGVMAWYADDLGYGEEREFWRLVGLLHDVDFEQFPEEHCVRGEALLLEAGVDPEIVRAAMSHGYGICSDIEPLHEMEKVLYATDELTGLISAVTVIRPSRSTLDLKLSSLKKKFKQNSFAAGCSRDTIRDGAERLGWELDLLLERTIAAMQQLERDAAAAAGGD
ncbi:MAG: HD domain-containing protein [Bacillota bacterium]|nr:HD domain-containing protein [Bacillota bacterium]